MKCLRSLAVLMLPALILGACGPGQGTPQPPEIYYGQDTCARCGMHISDPKFAAALLPVDGEWRKYDDIGCLLDDYIHGGIKAAAIYVHDYHTGEWVDAKVAFFVQSAIPTPMGSGLVAFRDRASAEKFMEEFAPGATVMNFEQVVAMQAEQPAHRHEH